MIRPIKIQRRGRQQIFRVISYLASISTTPTDTSRSTKLTPTRHRWRTIRRINLPTRVPVIQLTSTRTRSSTTITCGTWNIFSSSHSFNLSRSSASSIPRILVTIRIKVSGVRGGFFCSIRTFWSAVHDIHHLTILTHHTLLYILISNHTLKYQCGFIASYSSNDLQISSLLLGSIFVFFHRYYLGGFTKNIYTKS